MRNIASLVLNYSTLLGGGRSSRVNGRTLRVKNFSKLVLCTLLLLAAGCKGKNEPTPSPQSIDGNVPSPEWTQVKDYDMSSSMTVILKVDLALTYESQVKNNGWVVSENDRLAAFDGDNCIGIAQADNGLFYLYVTAPQKGTDVTIAYYSATLKNLFYTEQPISFRNDAIIGTVSDPFTPKWVVAK